MIKLLDASDLESRETWTERRDASQLLALPPREG